MKRNLVGLDHVQIAAPRDSASAARHFYGTILGMEELPVPAVLLDRACCWFRCGALEIHIGIQPDFHPAKKAHPAFVSDDLEAVKTAFRAEGIAFTEDFDLSDRRRLFAYDPWGNRLEFLQKHC